MTGIISRYNKLRWRSKGFELASDLIGGDGDGGTPWNGASDPHVSKCRVCTIFGHDSSK